MAVFKIAVHGKIIKLYEGQTLTTVEESTWFSNEVKADYSFPVSFPADENIEALGVLDVLDIVPEQRFPCVLDQDGKSRDAFLEILEVFDNRIEVNIVFNLAVLTCMELNLREANIPNPNTNIEDTYADGINEEYPTTFVYFPEIVNPGHYERPDTENPKNPDWENIVNQHDTGNYSFRINPYDFALLRYRNRNSLAPCPSVLGMLEHFFALDGFRLVGKLVRQDWLKRLFTYSNQSLDAQGDLATWEDVEAANNTGDFYIGAGGNRVKFATTTKPAHFSLANNEYSVNGDGVFRIQFAAAITNYSFSSTSVTIEAVLQGDVIDTQFVVVASQGFAFILLDFEFEFTAGDLAKKLYFIVKSANQIRLSGVFFKIKIIEPDIYVVPQNPTNFAQYLPDMSFADYWNEFLKTFTLKPTYDFEKREISLDFKDVALSTLQPAPLPGFAQKYRYRYDAPKSILAYYSGNSDNFLNNGNDELIYQQFWKVTRDVQTLYSEKLEVADEVLDLRTHPLVRAESNDRITLGVAEQGNSEPYGNNASPSPIRYGFYVGFVGGRPSADWLIDNVSLVPGRDFRSVFARFFDWYTLSNREPREVEITLDIEGEERINIEAPVMAATHQFLVREKETEHGDGLKRVRLLCKKL